MHEFLCLIPKSNTTFHELSKSYLIDAILSQIEGENSKYIFGPSSSVMTVLNSEQTYLIFVSNELMILCAPDTCGKHSG